MCLLPLDKAWLGECAMGAVLSRFFEVGRA